MDGQGIFADFMDLRADSRAIQDTVEKSNEETLVRNTADRNG